MSKRSASYISQGNNDIYSADLNINMSNSPAASRSSKSASDISNDYVFSTSPASSHSSSSASNTSRSTFLCSSSSSITSLSDASSPQFLTTIGTNDPNHFIRQTFLGPICTKCSTKVSLYGNLYIISSKTIIRHWKKNNCFIGDIKNLNAKDVERNLAMSIMQLYKTIHNNPSLASKVVQGQFHCKSTGLSPYCSCCGYVGIARNVRRHVANDAYTCTSQHVMTSRGTVLTDKNNFCIAQKVLDTISSGKFELPIDRLSNTIITHPNTDDSVFNSSISSITDAIMTTPAKYLPKDNEIDLLCSPESDDSTSLNSFAMAELTNCFGSEENAKKAREYLTFFILLLSQHAPGSLRNTLYSIGEMMSSPFTDPNFRLLLDAGKNWFTSDAANMDVRMVPVNHRNAIYLVGNSFTEKDKDLLKGCTFVWSDSVDHILEQYASLLTYAYHSQWPIIELYLSKVNYVYRSMLEKNTTGMDIDEINSIVTNKIVNSTIIFGLLCDLLMEDPIQPNGPNCIYRYLAGVCVIVCARSKKISLRSANGISRSANACLRLLRHAVCSFYVRQSVQMSHNLQSDSDFQLWVNDFLRKMQVCSSIGHICRTIRTARDVDRKSPSSVYKAFNDTTGDLLVHGNEIRKTAWRVAIPTACEQWDEHLLSLFPNHASLSSERPLHLLFNLNHSILLKGDYCRLNIENNHILLSEFQPNFPK